MEHKKVAKLNDAELDQIRGGQNGEQELPKDVCPVCNATCMVHFFDTIDGVRREMAQCQDCHRAYYKNDLGKLVILQKWC